ncbi:MAG: DUF3148 domain-containing protein [Cyanobacteriota bacterium]|nr:DUF3148 domain-containing protein [Cyanobacteriota bacterium]
MAKPFSPTPRTRLDKGQGSRPRGFLVKLRKQLWSLFCFMLRIPIGSTVQVIALPPFLKTADPMPMLRPAHLIQVGETGSVTGQRPGGYHSVRFANGVFLIDPQYLQVVS